MPDDATIGSYFCDPGTRRLTDGFKTILSTTRLHAPVDAYVHWLRVLRCVSEWNSSQERAKLQAILDKALLDEYPPGVAKGMDNWQRCAILITHAVWGRVTGAGYDLDLCARLDPEQQDLYKLIAKTLMTLYDSAASATTSGPCAFYYLAQAASMVPGVAESVSGPVQLYLQVLRVMMDCAALVRSVPQHPDQLSQVPEELKEIERKLRSSSEVADKEIKRIEDEFSWERRKQELEKERHQAVQNLTSAAQDQVALLQQKIARIDQELRRRPANSSPVLQFLCTRLGETRTSLDEKAEYVRDVYNNARPYGKPPKSGFRLYRWLLVQLSGNPRRMNNEGWFRLACLVIGAAFLAGSVIIAIKRAPASTSAAPPPNAGILAPPPPGVPAPAPGS